MFTTVWRFTVRPGRTAEFERHYGPDGTWAALFRTAPGYVRTELFRVGAEGEYLTVDIWQDEASFHAFRQTRAAEYEELDRTLEELTVAESKIG